MLYKKVIGKLPKCGVSREEFDALKAKVDKYHPDGPEPEPTPVKQAYSVVTVKPTQATIAELVDPTTERPSDSLEVNMTSLSRPTMCYIVYPQSWEVIENDILVIPYMVDANGFEIGATIDGETPLLVVQGVVYRVLDIRLGKGIYRLNFKR